MRFAFVVNNYPPRIGGVELHVHSLAVELVRRGHEVTVVTLGSTPGWTREGGVEVLTLPERFRVADTLGFPLPGTRRRLTRLLKDRRIDLVSTHTRFFPMSVVGGRAARAANLPVVHTEHGSDYVASPSLLIRLASRLVDRTLGRSVLRRADRVLGVSESVVDFVARLAAVKSDVFYNAIQPPEEQGNREAVTARPSHLVFVGRLVPGKGWQDFLRLIADLRAAGVPVTGEVVGDGPDREQLEEVWHELGLEAVVQLRGRLLPAEVRRAVRGATLVNPTVLSEGFQTTLLETIAEAGRVVTYPVPGASLLASQGAPVFVTAERTTAGLLAAVRTLLDRDPPPASRDMITEWCWPSRADQYVRIGEETLRR